MGREQKLFQGKPASFYKGVVNKAARSSFCLQQLLTSGFILVPQERDEQQFM